MTVSSSSARAFRRWRSARTSSSRLPRRRRPAGACPACPSSVVLHPLAKRNAEDVRGARGRRDPGRRLLRRAERRTPVDPGGEAIARRRSQAATGGCAIKSLFDSEFNAPDRTRARSRPRLHRGIESPLLRPRLDRRAAGAAANAAPLRKRCWPEEIADVTWSAIVEPRLGRATIGQARRQCGHGRLRPRALPRRSRGNAGDVRSRLQPQSDSIDDASLHRGLSRGWAQSCDAISVNGGLQRARPGQQAPMRRSVAHDPPDPHQHRRRIAGRAGSFHYGIARQDTPCASPRMSRSESVAVLPCGPRPRFRRQAM